MGMRFTFLAWFFFAACLGLSAGGPPDLAALLRSAEAGDAEAQFTLASALYQGGSAEQAVGWLKKAAERKHPKAWRLLGDFHAKGLVAKGKADPREAASCYLKSAALGDAAWAWIGVVRGDPVLELVTTAGGREHIDVAALDAAWRGGCLTTRGGV